MPRALIIHPGALGDVLLALPALAHLAAAVPGVQRVVAMAPRLAGLLHGSPYADASVGLETFGLHRLFTAETDPAVVHELGGYDLIVSWFGAGESVYRRRMADLGVRTGCRVVVARATPEVGTVVHASRHLLETLVPLGPVPDPPPAARLTVQPAERAWACRWLEERGLETGRVVLLHPGAGSPAKIWPDFPALARRLGRIGLPVVTITGPADATTAAALAARAALPASWTAADLPLPALTGLFGGAALFVGNDSGLSHLAAVVGAPALVLFGPTDPRIWAPSGPNVTVLAGSGPGSRDPWEGLALEAVEQAILARAGPSRVDVA